MPSREEYEAKLLDMVEKISGSLKSKVSGTYRTCLRGRINKNYANPEMSICLEEVQGLIADGAYTWTDKHGKTWLPVRLQVWAGTKKDEAVTPVTEAPPTESELSDPLPF
jgi:hypothetical protein